LRSLRSSGTTGLKWLEALGHQRIRPGLLRTRALLDGLGSPERSFRPILIGGTNGKGSTSAALAAILHAAGLRTGLYTSPHLVRVTERVRLLEEDVSEALLDDALSLVASVAGPAERGPTYFEALTVAAFELFRRARVEVAVVEVGIGGRLDATNVLLPVVSVVTNVGADHLEVLGPALADVAREKAGIFRPSQPALVGAGASAPEVMAALHTEAARIGARLVEVPPTERWDGVFPLAGAHQRANVALAVAAAHSLAPLDDATIARGLSRTRWPGRLQRLFRPGRREVILDGAHNPDGALAVAAWLDAAGLAGRIDLLFGAMGDKDLAGVFEPLATRARRVVLAAAPSPRAAAPDALKVRLGRDDAQTAPSVEKALASLDAEGPIAPPVLVSGSLYLVGEVLRLFEHESG
jgi:dihydrofolate synthase/folylpolyglutamate synthase